MHSNSDSSPSTLSSTATGPSGAVAIVGVAGRYPGGANSPQLLWRMLTSGVDAVSEAAGDRWDLGWHHPDARRVGRVYTKAGGYLDQIDGFDAAFFGLSPREARQVDPQQRLLLELAWEAHEDAGVAPRGRAGSNTGVFVGISSNDYGSLVGADSAPDAYSNTGNAFSIAANRISYQFDLRGPSFAVDTACSSSLVCVHQACVSLLAGECDAALAGGVSVLTHIRPWLGFAKASMLSPTGRCRSFDARGDGYVRSEGGGLVLLKRLEDAERDGDRILGVILGSGINSDGRTVGLSMPNGEAQEALLRKVYAQAGVAPEDVFYVEAHGTGTAVGDPIECGALGRVLGTPRANGSRCLIGSIKSNIGHLEAASGIAGLTKVILSLQHREVPANLHFATPNPKIDFDAWKLQVVSGARAVPPSDSRLIMGVNSFGFGGANAHVVVAEHRAPGKPVAVHAALGAPAAAERTPRLLVLSGHTEGALRSLAARYVDLLQSWPGDWAAICDATATGRSPMRHRLAVAATDSRDAAAKLAHYVAQKPAPRMSAGQAVAPAVPVAFVYSGNGPQWWGMGRELLAENEVFRAEVEAIDAIFAPLAGWSLIDEMKRPESESRIDLTEIAQPMLFAQQAGLTKVLESQGVRPAAVLGHSVGEAAAAYASGALTREQATRVIFHRSAEQAKTAGKGRMAALGVSDEEARAAIAKVGGWLEVAAVNSPAAVTVAGDAAAVQKLVDAVTASGKFARALALNYPFHTEEMEPIREGLIRSLEGLRPTASTVPFISTVDGGETPGEQLDAHYWFRNVREQVRFHDAVSHVLQKSGIVTFIEIGPHPVLRDYVLQSAKAASVSATALPTLRRPGRQGPEPESDNLWTAICAAYACGAAERTSRHAAAHVELPTYPWQRERHWRGGVRLPESFAPIRRDHPLLGYRVPSIDGLWENALDTNRLPYLLDHVVQGATVFPAAGYIEAALSAGRLLLGEGTIDIENFEILRPLVIPAQGDPLLQTSVDAKDGTYEIRSCADRESGEWTVHVRGRLSRGDEKPGKIKLADVAARMEHTVAAAAHYLDAKARGLEYGPTFQGVGGVQLTPPDAATRMAMAEIRLPFLAADPNELAGYRSHPSLFDSCLQALVALIAQNETRKCSTIPVQLARVRSYAPLSGVMVCHVTMRRESARSAVADFRIADPDGNVLMAVDGARCQKVDFSAAGAESMMVEWWRPDFRASSTAVPEPLLAPSATFAAMEAEIARIVDSNDRAGFYRDVRPKLNALAGAYAARAIAALHPGELAFDLLSLARAGKVKRDQTARLAMLVRMAEEDGRLIKDGAKWKWSSPNAHLSARPDALWRALFEAHPRHHAELLALSAVGDNLADRLRGQDASDANTANGNAILDQLRDTSPFQAIYNQLARGVVETLLGRWPKGRPVRVLEIGGGAGGLSSWVLPALPPDRADCLFTDPSDAVVARAERRLAAYRVARFATVDPTRDLAEQGVADRSFDIVLAANVVGAMKDPAAVLANIKAAIAPGGCLIAIESNKDRFADMVTGTGLGVAAGDLAAAGFVDVATIDDVAACPAGDTPQQSVLLASVPSTTPPAPLQRADVSTKRWLIITESVADRDALARPLLLEMKVGDKHAAVASATDGVDAVKDAIRDHRPDDIVLVSGRADAVEDILAAQRNRALLAVEVAKSAEALRQEKPCRLTLVTRGAFATANGDGPVDPRQTTLWGFGRVATNELPHLNTRLIDLHAPKPGPHEVVWLADELSREDDESEVQWSGGFRYLNRLRQTNAADEARGSGRRSREFAVDFHPSGGLDSLHLRSLARRAPGAHEVEIAVKAAGLNFRDVLWTMGMLPEEAVEHGFSGPTIGMECAGEVVRVGVGVTAVKPGDRVVAFASSCFASHVTTDAGSVAIIPDSLDFGAAATIPTAFLTAYYALDHLARLEPGETVLIHGAAGGVGLAAVQIAKLKGARVIGTAGSARKRRMLEMLGVDHVLNSRSLDFADDVARITNGVGVDVVLNSLAGEAITKSLNCLRPFGRFLEIGKRDLYANSRIGLRPFRNNLSYFGIDADTLLIERAPLARRLFGELVGLFASGALRPIAFQEVPVSRAAEAFRAMQQSKHVGKLVVSMRLDPPDGLPVVRPTAEIDSTGTYLVTGGLGGFGLATAQWLASRGVRSLALLSRRGATTEEAVVGVERLRKAGATVRAFAVDVSDAAALDDVLKTVRAGMAPLKGVIHSAAVIEDAPILNLTAEQVNRVFEAKMVGAWNLHQATRMDALDLFVLYSSSSAVVGNPGQAAYVAANLYLDSLAQHRRSLGLPALAVSWGAIKDAGFLTRHEAVVGMLKSRAGLDATPAEAALADLGRALAAGSTRVCVARFDLQRLSQVLPAARTPRFAPVIPADAAGSVAADQSLPDMLAKMPPAERRPFAIERVRGHAARVLGTSAPHVGVDQPLPDLGLDSLMAVELAGRIERDVGQPVSVMQMLTARSLTSIAELMLKTLGAGGSDTDANVGGSRGSRVLV